MVQHEVDIIGIGIGPSNLSLAALLQPVSGFSSIFFDKQKTFQWHRGMQLPSTKLQVSYLKDLVTLVDPKNPFSFLSFLSSQKRLYQFINANFQDVSRAEFSQYYRWVCEVLSSQLMFESEVKEVSFLHDKLHVKTSKASATSASIVLGNGLSPFIPPFAKNKLCETVHHSSVFMESKNNYKDKKVAIIGGGQSGAEITSYLLSDEKNLPEKITWVTRRDNYLPLDSSPFVNELFTPQYSEYFYSLPHFAKKAIIKKQKLFSDGISHTTLQEIYRLLYEVTFIHNYKTLFLLMPESEVIDISRNSENWTIQAKNVYTKATKFIDADIIVLCTGYRYELPNFMGSLSDKIDRDVDGNLIINKDFSLSYSAPSDVKIYIQNGALHSRGISDPNLSLVSWRSATIINSIAKRKIYDINNSESFFKWQASPDQHPMKDYPGLLKVTTDLLGQFL